MPWEADPERDRGTVVAVACALVRAAVMATSAFPAPSSMDVGEAVRVTSAVCAWVVVDSARSTAHVMSVRAAIVPVMTFAGVSRRTLAFRPFISAGFAVRIVTPVFNLTC